jgi:hypothetical protein|uniref:Uncharacterized protein n=1 Tax=Desulfobacca acetoxidans TaxID=60893 RepID=A0A7V6A605_9BACT
MVPLAGETYFSQKPTGSPPLPGNDGWRSGGGKKRGDSSRARGQSAAIIVLLTLFLSLIFPSGLLAELPVSRVAKVCPAPDQNLTFSYTAVPLYQFGSKVDGGGSLSVFTLIFSAGVKKQENEQLKAGLDFTYIYDGYSFSGMTGFRVPYPWSAIHTFGLDVPLIYFVTQDCTWKIYLVPTGQFSGESTATFGDALVYGGSFGVSHVFSPKVELGIGLAGYYNLAQATFFPYPIVKIKISDRIQITNPFGASPAGPGGGVLNYKLTQHWSVGLGGAYRSYRFRLDHNGPIPGGIGQYRSCPVFATLGYQQSPAFRAEIYAGATLWNKIYIDDHGGDELLRTKQNAAPMLGFSASGAF